MPHKKLANALLDAQVAFILDQISGPQLQSLIEEELDAGLAAAAELTLNEVVTRQSVKDTIQVFAVELKLRGGIPELVGDIARDLHAHPVLAQTTLADLMPDKLLGEIVDKLLEMKETRQWLVHTAVSSPPFLAIASDLIHQGIKGYLAENPVTRSIPGASSVLKLGKAVMSKTGLDDSIDDNLRRYIRKSVKATAKASERSINHSLDSPAAAKKMVLSIWDKIKHLHISKLRDDAAIRDSDVEEAFVIGYTYWHELRKTDIYRLLIGAGVDRFFDKYGNASLRELLDDIGITRPMMLDEAMRYAPPVIQALQQKQLLEKLLRRNLGRFYHSAEFEEALKRAT